MRIGKLKNIEQTLNNQIVDIMKVNNEDLLLEERSTHELNHKDSCNNNRGKKGFEGLLNLESDLDKIHLQMEKEVDEFIDSILDSAGENTRGCEISKSNEPSDRGTNEISETISADDGYHYDDNMDMDASMYSDSDNSMEEEMGKLRMISEDLRQDIESQNHGSMMHLLGQLSDDEGSVVSECSSSFMVEFGSSNDIIPYSKEENVANSVSVSHRLKENKKHRRRRIVSNKLKCTNARKGSTSSSSGRKVRSTNKKNRSLKKARKETRVFNEERHRSPEIEIPNVVKNGLLKYLDDATPIVFSFLFWLAISRFFIHSTDSVMDSIGTDISCTVRSTGTGYMC